MLAKQGVQLSNIIITVCEFYGVSRRALFGKARGKRLCHVRSMAMYLCRERSHSSYPELGREFDRHHTSILSAYRRAKERIETSDQIRDEYQRLCRILTDLGIGAVDPPRLDVH